MEQWGTVVCIELEGKGKVVECEEFCDSQGCKGAVEWGGGEKFCDIWQDLEGNF